MKIRFLFIIIVAFLSSKGQTVEYNLFNISEVFVDSIGNETIIDVSLSNAFKPYSSYEKSQSFKPYTFWIKFTPPNDGEYYLISKNIFIDKLKLYVPRNNSWHEQESGLLQLDNMWYSVLSVKVPSYAKNKTCYISLQSNCISSIDLWLIKDQTLIKQEIFKIGFYIFIIVLILIYLIIVLSLYFFSKQKTLIFLAVYSFTSILMILFTNGYLYKLFPDFGLVFNKWSFVYIVDLYWGSAALLSFVLLDVKSHSQKLKKLFYIALGLLIFMMITPFFIERQTIAKIHLVIPVIFIFFNTLVGFYLYFKHKVKTAIFLSIGWLVYFSLIMIWTISKTNHLPKSFFIDNAPAFGLIIEFIIFVIIGAKQYIKEQKERLFLKQKVRGANEFKLEIEKEYFDLYKSLSKREKQVLELISKGFLDKEIADELNLSLPSVRTYLKRIFGKLNVTNRTEASNIYNKLEIVQLI